MESIERNVSDIAPNERAVYEHVLGHKLCESQRVIISVAEEEIKQAGNGSVPKARSADKVDDWAIFRNLSDDEIGELESLILDRSPGRELDI